MWGVRQHSEKRTDLMLLTSEQATLATVGRVDRKEARVEATDLIQMKIGGWL